MVEVSFGEWVQRRRLAAGLTQEELARQVGCATITLRKIEADERRPSIAMVERLADIFLLPAAERPKFLRFARGDWTQPVAEGDSMRPWRTPSAPRDNLPAAVTALIGREQEVARARNYLQDTNIRLVTLIGPPGIGKTSLSLEIARAARPNFPTGVFFVALAPLEDAALVPGTIAQALGYVEAKGLTARQQLVEGIGDTRLLLVLDNCEHLIEGVAPLVSELLAGCPRLKIVATSRESLRVAGEWVLTVPVLGAPPSDASLQLETAAQYPALVLFAERARAVRADFALTAENLQPVAAICARLEGLPLAIELIAARMRLLSPQALLERMTDTFVLSADGMRASSARQRTLGNAIGWSHDHLSTDEQRIFAGLAVFMGSFTLEAAEAVCQPPQGEKSIAELVTLLLDKSLLQRACDACDEQRFSMLVTIRQFALERLRGSGDEVTVRDRHLAYFLELAEHGDREMRSPQQGAWIDRIENELDNFRAALEWGVANRRTESVLRLLCALGWPWEVRGHYGEALAWLQRVRALPDVDDYPLVYARLLNHMGRYYWTQGRLREAHALLEQSQAIARKLGPAGEHSLAETLSWLGVLLNVSEGNREGAKAALENSLDLYRRSGDESGMALATFHLGIVEGDLNHDDLALSLLEQSQAYFRQSGDLFFVSRVAIFLGYLSLKHGMPDRALHFFGQNLAIDQQLRFWSGIVDAWSNLGFLHRQAGDYEQARRCYEEGVLVCREHTPTARDPFYLSGLMALRFDDYIVARQRFSYLLHLVQGADDKPVAAPYLRGMAAVAAGTGEPERAALLDGAAASLGASEAPSPPDEAAEFDRHIQLARDHLGLEHFGALHTAGRAMLPEQAIKVALT